MNKRIKKKKGISNKMRYYFAFYDVPSGGDPYDYVDVFKAANDEEALKHVIVAADTYGRLHSLCEHNSQWINDFKRTVIKTKSPYHEELNDDPFEQDIYDEIKDDPFEQDIYDELKDDPFEQDIYDELKDNPFEQDIYDELKDDPFEQDLYA